MKTLQKYRLLVQLLSITLFTIGFFTHFTITAIIIIIATISTGAYYCGWICPYGTLQDLSSKLAHKLGIKQRKMPKTIQNYLFYIRYIIFAVFMLFIVDILFTLMTFDPRTNFLMLLSGNIITITSIVVLTSFLIISLFFERPFCNYLCIEGAKFGLMSLLRPVTIIRNADSCVNCKKCDNVCPMNIEISTIEHLHSPNCINCFQCIDVCPVEDTLTYGPIKITNKIKTYYFRMTILAVFIGSIFLLYNLASTNATNNITPNTALVESSDSTNSNNTISENTTMSEDNTNTLDNTPNSGNGQHKNRNSSEQDSASTNNTDIGTSETNTDTSVDVILEPDTTAESTTQSESTSSFTDGTYSGVGFGFRGDITVEVTIKDEQITFVEVIDHVEDYKWFSRAYDATISRIISAQSADVDTVSGATFSSRGIIDGANAALESAKN